MAVIMGLTPEAVGNAEASATNSPETSQTSPEGSQTEFLFVLFCFVLFAVFHVFSVLFSIALFCLEPRAAQRCAAFYSHPSAATPPHLEMLKLSAPPPGGRPHPAGAHLVGGKQGHVELLNCGARAREAGRSVNQGSPGWVGSLGFWDERTGDCH